MIIYIFALLASSLCSYQIKTLKREYVVGDSMEVTERATLQVRRLREAGEEFLIYSIAYMLANKVGLVRAYYGEDASGVLLSTEMLMREHNRAGIKVHLKEGRADGYSGSIPETFYLHMYVVYPTGGEITNVIATPTPSEDELRTHYGARPVGRGNHVATLKFAICAELPSIYACSKQTTTVRFESAQTSFISLDTDFHKYKISKTPKGTVIALEQLDYVSEHSCTLMTMRYYSNAYQLAVTADRAIVINGPMLRTRSGHRRFVTIQDNFTVRNTNPWSSETHFANKDVLIQQHYVGTLPLFLTVELSCSTNFDKIAYYDRIGKIDTIELDTELTAELKQKNPGYNRTIIRIKPRFALMGNNMTAFTLKYTCDEVFSLESQGEGDLENGSHMYGLQIPAGPLIHNSYYKSFTICIYPPSGARNTQLSVPFTGSSFNRTYAGTLDVRNREGGCVSTGLSAREKMSAPLTAIWEYNTVRMLKEKLWSLSINFFVLMSCVSMFRVVVGK